MEKWCFRNVHQTLGRAQTLTIKKISKSPNWDFISGHGWSFISGLGHLLALFPVRATQEMDPRTWCYQHTASYPWLFTSFLKSHDECRKCKCLLYRGLWAGHVAVLVPDADRASLAQQNAEENLKHAFPRELRTSTQRDPYTQPRGVRWSTVTGCLWQKE